MLITKFIRKVTLLEGKKKSVSIAQVAEIVNIINKLTGGLLYILIRHM